MRIELAWEGYKNNKSLFATKIGAKDSTGRGQQGLHCVYGKRIGFGDRIAFSARPMLCHVMPKDKDPKNLHDF